MPDASKADKLAKIGGIASTVAMIKQMDPPAQREMLADMDQKDPELAAEIRKLLVTFDDIERVPDREFQKLVREFDTPVLARAMKGASDSLKQKFRKNMSSRMYANLMDEVEMLGPLPKKEQVAARDRISLTLRKAVDNGDIALDGSERMVE